MKSAYVGAQRSSALSNFILPIKTNFSSLFRWVHWGGVYTCPKYVFSIGDLLVKYLAVCCFIRSSDTEMTFPDGDGVMSFILPIATKTKTSKLLLPNFTWIYSCRKLLWVERSNWLTFNNLAWVKIHWSELWMVGTCWALQYIHWGTNTTCQICVGHLISTWLYYIQMSLSHNYSSKESNPEITWDPIQLALIWYFL